MSFGWADRFRAGDGSAGHFGRINAAGALQRRENCARSADAHDAAGNGRHRPNLVVVGGSFDFKILKLFDRSDQLTIPKAVLGGGEIGLEFHLARPTSPEELGLGKDSRKLGIRISAICLGEAGK